MMTSLLLVTHLLAVPACAQAPAAPAVSTAPVKALTPADLYDGAKFRDPFRVLNAGGGGGAAPAAPAAYDPETFSIHGLDLKGILKDRSGDYAVLVEAGSGAGFVLRGGQLFDYKNKRVPGVTGIVQFRQKTVVLMTPDKDVQTLRLGEQAESEPARP